MNKVVIKELEKRYLIVEILLYLMYAVTGFALLGVCKDKLFDVMDYAYAFFYSLAFFTLLAYFINRRPINYELLFLGLINVCVGSFVLAYMAFPSGGFILSDAVLVYAICNVINKLYHCKKMIEERDINFFPKIAVTIMLFFIGVVVVSELYTKISAGILILGYYFAVFGLLSMLEPLTKVLSNNKSIKEFVFNFLSYNDREEKKEKVVVKEIETEKPKVKKKTRKSPAKKKTTTKKTTTKKTTSTKKTTKK